MNKFDVVINRKNTSSLKWDATKARFGKEDLLPMWVADMDFKAPEQVLQALHKRIEHGVFGYSLAPDSTYEAICNWLKRRFQWEIQKEWIAFSSGVVPAISTIIHAFTEPGDEIIVQSPVYYPFFSQVEQNKRVLLNNQLIEDNGVYKMDVDQLEQMITEKTKMIILSHPHNPVGRVWTKEELTRLGDICVKHNILIISDEIHCDLTYKGVVHTPLASISEQFAKQTITCMAPSKTFNLAGLQASYLIIPNKEHKAKFQRAMAQQGLSEPNILGIIAMETAYNECEEWLEQFLDYMEENARIVEQFLETELPQLKIIKPEAMYLLWIDCRKLNLDKKELEKRIIEKGNLALNQGYIFGGGGEGFIRLNIACPKATLIEGLNRLKAALS